MDNSSSSAGLGSDMKVILDLIYENKDPKRVEVEIKGEIITPAIMNKIDKAAEKAFADDKDWIRWNLIEIEEPFV